MKTVFNQFLLDAFRGGRVVLKAGGCGGQQVAKETRLAIGLQECRIGRLESL